MNKAAQLFVMVAASKSPKAVAKVYMDVPSCYMATCNIIDNNYIDILLLFSFSLYYIIFFIYIVMGLHVDNLVIHAW